MYPANQSFLVLGLSRSGVAAAELLLSQGAETFVFDDVRGGAVENSIKSLAAKGAKIAKKAGAGSGAKSGKAGKSAAKKNNAETYGKSAPNA